MWKQYNMKDPFLRIGVTTSGVGHVIFFIIFAFNMMTGPGTIKPQIVYSVTIEGGKSLGAISQVAKDKNSQIAPPKKIQEPKKTEKVEVKKVDPKKPNKIETKPEEKVVVPKKEVKPPVAVKQPVKKAEQKKIDPKQNQTKPSSAVERDKKLQEAIQRYTGESTAAAGTGFGAGRLGGEKFGGGVERPPEFFEYKKLLENYIKSGWRWFDPNAKLEAQVQFDLTFEGEIENVRVSASSGLSEFDDSVVRAVKKANPVPAPPESVYEFFREVRITFVPGE